MSDDQNTQENTQQMSPEEALQRLKARADIMGITYSNNIGFEALSKKIDEKLAGLGAESDKSTVSQEEAAKAPNPLLGETSEKEVPREMTIREWMAAEQLKLIRCRITNLDPKKKDLPGEIFTIANEYLGTVRKFVPYGEVTDNGYHLPFCLYEMLRTKRFLNIRVSRDPRTKVERVTQNWAPEFSIEVMEPLTQAELNDLAQAQIAAGSVESQS